MSEVELLYKNAGVGYQTYVVNTDPPVEYPQIDFTAEKQLELICWLVNNKDSIMITNKPKPINLEVLKESIAYGINLLWQDLTEQERTEIAEILRG